MDGNFAILNPCPKKWGDLVGDGRVRYCDLCKKNVHALDEYSKVERDGLWRESGGDVCGMLASMSFESARSRRAILLGALLTAAAPLFAQSGRLRIRVTDASGAVVSDAPVSVLGTLATATTDETGEAVFTGLRLGDSQISIVVPGFKTFRSTVTIQGSGEQKLEATLQIGELVGEVVTVEVAGPSYVPSAQALDLPVGLPAGPSYLPAPQTPKRPPPQRTKRPWWQILR